MSDNAVDAFILVGDIPGHDVPADTDSSVMGGDA